MHYDCLFCNEFSVTGKDSPIDEGITVVHKKIPFCVCLFDFTLNPLVNREKYAIHCVSTTFETLQQNKKG